MDGARTSHVTLLDFAAWAPILQVVRGFRPDLDDWSGHFGLGGFSFPGLGYDDFPRAIMQAGDPLREALRAARRNDVDFTVRTAPDGHTTVTLTTGSRPRGSRATSATPDGCGGPHPSSALSR